MTVKSVIRTASIAASSMAIALTCLSVSQPAVAAPAPLPKAAPTVDPDVFYTMLGGGDEPDKYYVMAYSEKSHAEIFLQRSANLKPGPRDESARIGVKTNASETDSIQRTVFTELWRACVVDGGKDAEPNCSPWKRQPEDPNA